MDAIRCPDRAELERFIVGGLSEPSFGRVADHIERCLDREETLRELDRLADPLLSRLRRLSAVECPDGSQTVPVPDALMASARSARVRGGAAVWFSAGEANRRLGKFELLEQLGVGSFGYVFRARDAELGR